MALSLLVAVMHICWAASPAPARPLQEDLPAATRKDMRPLKGPAVAQQVHKHSETAAVFVLTQLLDLEGHDTPDGRQTGHGRFRLRLDWQAADGDTLTIQDHLYHGYNGGLHEIPPPVEPLTQAVNDRVHLFGGYVLTRWHQRFSLSVASTLHVYYDRAERHGTLFDAVRETADLDFQHQLISHAQHAFVWGLGYRFTRDATQGSFAIALDPASRSEHLVRAFVQDDIALLPYRLRLTLGTRVEQNEHTGFEVQPNARLLWTPDPRHTAWGAVSREVRTPSRIDDDFRLRFATIRPETPTNRGRLPAVLTLLGNRRVVSEKILAYELGYRVRPLSSLWLDVAVFYNIYQHLTTVETRPLPTAAGTLTQPFAAVPLVFDNKLMGETLGVELAADWRPVNWWRFQAAYTYRQLNLNLVKTSRDVLRAGGEGTSPQHQISFRSMLDLPWHLTLDFWMRYVDILPDLNVRSYLTFDARLAWKPSKRLEVSVVGQNLPSGHHSAFTRHGMPPMDIQRGVYGKVTWSF